MLYSEYESALGRLLLESDGMYLTGLWMNRERPEGAVLSPALPVFQETKYWLDGYFRGAAPQELPPLNPEGTPFQKQVWNILLTIPFGMTLTYGEIAREIAARMGKQNMSAQAVGGAVGRNPISILIPCHRVMGSGNRLTGYAGGLDNKLWLLRHEGWKGEGKK